MPRGRKKDLTIPPTRALVQQRDYRARRARYIQELEERCQRAEEENANLRKALAQTGQSSAAVAAGPDPEMVEASADLRECLAIAVSSLARFQQRLEISNSSRDLQFSQMHDQAAGAGEEGQPTHFPSPASSPGFAPSRPSRFGRKRFRSEEFESDDDSSPNYNSQSPPPPTLPPPQGRHSRSGSSDSDCCGGILDCRDLIDEDLDVREETGAGASESHTTFSSKPNESSLSYERHTA